MAKVEVIDYKWVGKWGPFKIKTQCGECDFDTALIKDMMKKEFKGKDISFEVKPWLDNWWRVIWKFAWHAPIIMVNGKVYSQGVTIKRKEFAKYVLSLP